VRELIFYHSPSGNCPIEDFLNSLAGKQAQKVLWVLRLVEELETIPRQYCKKLVDSQDLWEIRVQIGGNAFRILAFFVDAKVVVLTHGFAKKTQKVPRREIDLAQKRRQDYLRREKHHE